MAKVIRPFRDKLTWVAYRIGDDYEGGRAEELAALGYVAKETISITAIEPQVDEDTEPSVDYESMTKAQLTELAKERGIEPPKRATKDVLIDLLRG